MNFDQFGVKVFELARKEGFSEYEIYYTSGESLKVNVFEGKIDDYSVSGQAGAGFRGIFDGRMGYSHTSVLDDESASFIVKAAKLNAMVIETGETDRIFEGCLNYEKLNTYNTGLEMVGAKDMIELALIMENCSKSIDKRIKRVKNSGMSYHKGEVRIKNSKGMDIGYASNLLSAILVPVAVEGAEMNSGSAYRITRYIKDINAEDIAAEAVKDAVAYLGAAPVPSGEYSVLIRNEAASDLLETYSGIFNADRVQKGLSQLKDKTGTCIASDLLTVIDDPLLDGGVSSQPFDAEGVASFSKEVISKGILSTLLHNSRTAEKDKVKSTGNASRASYASAVDISPTNFFVKPSDASREELLDKLGDGLFITELQGMHSGANTVSGDFSLAARGFLVEKGRITRPVGQITVSGNFYTLLKGIKGVGSDLKFTLPGNGYFGSPSLLISSLSVAGK